MKVKAKVTNSKAMNIFRTVNWQVVEVLSGKQLKAEKAISDEEIYMPSSVEEVAYIQYTSGSTSDPKGVLILHRNYLHQVLSCAQSYFSQAW